MNPARDVPAPRRRRARIGLRVRVMIGFGLVTVTVTGVLSLLTFQLASSYMVRQRQDLAIAQAQLNARLVQGALQQSNPDLDALLTGLGSDVESAVLLVDNGRSITSGNLVDPGRLPTDFVDTVRGGRAAHQRLVLDGVPVLAVGFPLTSEGATYVEVFPLRELDRTFRFLSTALGLGVALSGLAGAGLGRWAASRALRPLSRLTDAAAVAAAGDLTVRLSESDRDLAPLARSFNATAERLEHRVAMDTRFAGDVSHELRSPVTTMLNAVAVLRRRRGELSGPAGSALDLLDADLTRFRSLVDDLLEISRAGDRSGTTPEQLDLVAVVQHAAHRAGAAPDTVHAPGGAVPVAGDRRRLERVVANLLDNAHRHAGGVVDLTVTLVGSGVSRRARLEVDDAGPGVPEQDRERIFERFARTEPGDRTVGGAGLGLALVTEHVRRHDGWVWVEGRPGGGSRFVVELPAAAP